MAWRLWHKIYKNKVQSWVNRHLPLKIETSSQLQVGWEDFPVGASVVEICGLEPSRTRIVMPGEGEVLPDPSMDYLVSEGFACCSGLIRRIKGIGFSLAHVQPIDKVDEVISEIAGEAEEALFIYGSRSEPMYDINGRLYHKKVPRRAIKLDTGEEHFGIALHVRTGEVSVIRKTPTRSVLSYALFG